MENNETVSDSSTDSEDSDDSDEIDQATSRTKRQIAWCGVDTEQNDSTVVSSKLQKQLRLHRPRRPKPKIIWPPQPSSSSSWLDLNHVQVGNPLYGNKMQLYCKTGSFLAIYPNGKIKGTSDPNDSYTFLELLSALHPGHVRIKGTLTNLHVAMDRRGRLYGESKTDEESTVFIEIFQASYTAYLSRKYAHLGWYIGIKKNGRVRKGPKTKFGQKAISFLPRRSIFE